MSPNLPHPQSDSKQASKKSDCSVSVDYSVEIALNIVLDMRGSGLLSHIVKYPDYLQQPTNNMYEVFQFSIKVCFDKQKEQNADFSPSCGF